MSFCHLQHLLQLLEISFNCLEEVESNIPVSPLHLAVSDTNYTHTRVLRVSNRENKHFYCYLFIYMLSYSNTVSTYFHF